jgi:hypothetical protein
MPPRHRAKKGDTDMAITLQSSINGGFTAGFMRKLPLLEKAMVAHGLEPSEFIISKDRASPAATLPFVAPFFYSYTVFVGDESFTVTEPNDEVFFDYLLKRCIAEDDEPVLLPTFLRAPAGIVRRFFRWMAQPI